MQGVIEVAETVAKPIENHITSMFCHYSALPGFESEALPTAYAKTYFEKEITRETASFIFNHFVIESLLTQMREQKLLLTNWPRLNDVKRTDSGALLYTFIFSCAPDLPLKEWKHFVFNPPLRKNYKDLDKQVVLFLKNEQAESKKQQDAIVEAGDWVNLTVTLVSADGTALIEEAAPHHYWMHITQETVAIPLHSACIGKNIGDVFVAEHFPFSTAAETSALEPCFYQITVTSISKGLYLQLDFFKSIFRLKTRADIHKKLIEVFSYRNDISQRKSIIEELFHLLFTKHRFEVPKHMITRKKEMLLQTLQRQPDYQVYKNHKDFDRYLATLAEKMLREEILIDHLSMSEHISVERHDIAAYLHLFNNDKLREFIYFKPMVDGLEEADAPIHESIITQAVLREKTLNSVIYTLSN